MALDPARRALWAVLGAGAVAASALLGAPAATADPPDCTAADMAGVAAGVSAATVSNVLTGRKPVSPALAAAVRGEETGIGSSEVYVGGGVNADNIRNCMTYLHQNRWDGVVSIECSGTDENTCKSVEWMRGVVKGLGKK